MKLKVSSDAAKWFIEELDLEQGDFVQFFLKIYGGIPTVHPNYFLGMKVGQQGNIFVKEEVEGINFFFTEEDSWFLEEYNMEVVKKDDEVEYLFHEV
ncbi:HesB/YadR/YfhF family protein [Ornithinibacillus halophilus]|uniref:Uncharacterized protein YneR n=1 Tax=Ornithinibacillus halophilus TaxID=930117 RepID=A0A1M5IKL0_9BACI|nr:hypothetical protein [Ornithinibacillus halophilus]SHG28313.1 Uncharacterized protein YneR [Ornithinibacillus halophilus]